MQKGALKSGTSSNRLGSYVVCALLLHALVLYIAAQFPFPLADRADGLTPRLVELFQEPDARPVVRSEASDEANDAKAEFRSDRRNRVREQTRNPRVGQHQSDSSPRRSEPIPNSEDGLKTGPAQQLTLGDLTQLAQNPYKLDDSIREGGQTVLNTDGLSYASFLHRLSDAIYPAWVRHLRDASDTLHLEKNPSGIKGNSFVTRLGVEMDSQGNIVSVQVLKSSGVPEFDDAPKSAFWDKEPFANPPSQMFAQNENTVRFVYEFHFELRNSFFSIFPSISL
jgi:TonB family protein